MANTTHIVIAAFSAVVTVIVLKSRETNRKECCRQGCGGRLRKAGEIFMDEKDLYQFFRCRTYGLLIERSEKTKYQYSEFTSLELADQIKKRFNLS